MTPMQIFNEILFIIICIVLIVSMTIWSVVTLLRYRAETHQLYTLTQRVDALEAKGSS